MTPTHDHYRTILLTELARRKRANPVYSLRAFARNLGMSPAHLSLVLNGKKRLTPRLARESAERLSLSPDERSRFLASTVPGLEFEDRKEDSERLLSEDEFKLISDWYHLAILSLAKTKKNIANPRLIGKNLGVDPILIKEALARLIRLGFLEIKNNKLVLTTAPLRTSTDVPSEAIRRYHRQTLNLALTKIDTVPVAKREFSAITMAVDVEKLPKAKLMIESFKRKLCKELETSSAQDVFTLSIQLFPLTDYTEET